MKREAKRLAAMTPAERFVEDHNAALAAGLEALDAIEARLRRYCGSGSV
jgi:hypothetical protein